MIDQQPETIIPFHFKPPDQQSGIIVPIPEAEEQIELLFQNEPFADTPDQKEIIKQTAITMMQEAFGYILKTMGYSLPDHLFSRKWVVHFTNSNIYRHQGILMRVPSQPISEAAQEGRDSYLYQRENANFAHEFMHNIADDEALSLLIEMIYMLEKDGDYLIQKFLRAYKNGVGQELSSAHLAGFQKIAGWLNYATAETMLADLPNQPLDLLKESFSKQVIEQCTANEQEAASL